MEVLVLDSNALNRLTVCKGMGSSKFKILPTKYLLRIVYF